MSAFSAKRQARVGSCYTKADVETCGSLVFAKSAIGGS